MSHSSRSQKRPRREPDLLLRERSPPPNTPLTPSAYRATVPGSASIVVDMGSSMLRASFSSDGYRAGAPRLQFPPYVARNREHGANGFYTPVGYEALATSNRSAARSPFDGSIANNSTLVERLLDGVLIRLGLADEDEIRHGVVLTEPPCQPNGVRAQFTELLFETHEVPKICFGVDALFSYMYNGHVREEGGLRYARRSGLVVSCGYNTTHVLPVHERKYYAAGTKRINAGGHHMTTNLSRRLQLRHPDYSTLFSYSRVEQLKHDACCVSEDYDAELVGIRDDVKKYEGICRVVKLPSAEGGVEKPGLSAEERERAKQLRIERGRRLSEMMKERNRAKAGTEKKSKEVEVAVTVADEDAAPLLAARQVYRDLEMITEAQDQDEDVYYLARVAAGFESQEAFDEELVRRGEVVESAREALGEEKAAIVDALWEKKSAEDELLRVPDGQLSAAGLKRKRKLAMLRGAAEARLRIRKEKEAAAERERVAAEVAEKARAEDPENYIANLRKQRAELAEKVKRRKAAKEAGSDRRSLAARQRMRLLAQHAGATGEVEDDNGGGGSKAGGRRKASNAKSKKPDDTFGMNDSDWDVYRDMRVRDDVGEEPSDNDSEVDRTALARLRSEILQMDPDEEDPTLVRPVGSALLYVPHPYADEIPLTIERIATPEILFQPSLIGLEQCGLIEAIELVVNSPTFADPTDRRSIVNEVFLTGAVAHTPGLEARIGRELRTRFPTTWGDGIVAGVRRARDPALDAWRGACFFADQGGAAFDKACVTKQLYDEVGPDYMGEHGLGNMYVPTPVVDPAEAERKRKLQSYKRSPSALVK
jgi:actin-related protein 5